MNLRAQQSHGLRDEAVPEPGGARLDAVVPSVRAGVIGVFDDAVGLLPAPLSIEIFHPASFW